MQAPTLSQSTGTVNVTGVTVSPVSASIAVNGTQQLTPTIAPANATNQAVSWSSSNTSVVTVDASGKITAVGTGSATITVTTGDGNKTATKNITVSPAVNVKATDETAGEGGNTGGDSTAPYNSAKSNDGWLFGTQVEWFF